MFMHIHDYSISQSNDATKKGGKRIFKTQHAQTVLMIHNTTNNSSKFSCLVCGVLAPGQLLPNPKEAVADSLLKWLLLMLASL